MNVNDLDNADLSVKEDFSQDPEGQYRLQEDFVLRMLHCTRESLARECGRGLAPPPSRPPQPPIWPSHSNINSNDNRSTEFSSTNNITSSGIPLYARQSSQERAVIDLFAAEDSPSRKDGSLSAVVHSAADLTQQAGHLRSTSHQAAVGKRGAAGTTSIWSAEGDAVGVSCTQPVLLSEQQPRKRPAFATQHTVTDLTTATAVPTRWVTRDTLPPALPSAVAPLSGLGGSCRIPASEPYYRSLSQSCSTNRLAKSPLSAGFSSSRTQQGQEPHLFQIPPDTTEISARTSATANLPYSATAVQERTQQIPLPITAALTQQHLSTQPLPLKPPSTQSMLTQQSGIDFSSATGATQRLPSTQGRGRGSFWSQTSTVDLDSLLEDL